jgi:cytochrome P450
MPDLGAGVTIEELAGDPHPVLRRLREHEPVAWIPPLDGWLVTRYDLVVQAMRDASTFTVDDPRFSTARVVGPSMLSLDGDEHARHRAPFVAPFRPGPVRERFAAMAADEARQLIDEIQADGAAELRRTFAGPLAASIVARALGLARAQAGEVLGWYDAIVAAVTEITAGGEPSDAAQAAVAELYARLGSVVNDRCGGGSLLTAAAAGSDLRVEEIVSNAAVLLFGGIETTEGMIANAVLHLLEREEALARVRGGLGGARSEMRDSPPEPRLLDAAIEESLRLEPAAAVIDRYATRATTLGGAEIATGELVRLSIAGANRDPAIFAEPDRFDLERTNARRHLAFAQGPHVCVGVHLARLEARTGIAALLERLPGLRLDEERPSAIRGLVFRKPPQLHVRWIADRPAAELANQR